MQASSAADMRPAVALLEKTPVLYETMLGDLPGELLQWKPGPEDARSYSRGVARDHLTRYAAARRAVVAVLKSAPASAGTRTAKHSELGLITLSQMLNEWASHDLGHVRQIAEIYRAHAFHPHCGPFQKYSNPKP
jgi:hypothetical protein